MNYDFLEHSRFIQLPGQGELSSGNAGTVWYVHDFTGPFDWIVMLAVNTGHWRARFSPSFIQICLQTQSLSDLRLATPPKTFKFKVAHSHNSILSSDMFRVTAYSADIAAIVSWQDVEAALAINDEQPFSPFNPETGLLFYIEFGVRVMDTLGTTLIVMEYSNRKFIF